MVKFAQKNLKLLCKLKFATNLFEYATFGDDVHYSCCRPETLGPLSNTVSLRGNLIPRLTLIHAILMMIIIFSILDK